MKTEETKKLQKIIGRFEDRKVVVLGDLMLDRYIWGRVSRISPEAPVPVVEVSQSTSSLGGAGNVAHNLLNLGAAPILVGVVGDDEEGRWIRGLMSENRGIVTDSKRPTTVKTRIIAHHQQVVRVDQERRRPVSPAVESAIADFLKSRDFDGLIISDYNKGIVTRTLMAKVLALARSRKAPVFVDPKVENIRLFSPATLLAPNHLEVERIVHLSCRTDAEAEQAGRRLMETVSSRYLIIKRGEQGMSVFERGRKAIHLPTNAREVFDVTGAGDTVLAVSALALLSGASIREAAVLANTAGGIVVGKIGTATVTPAELRQGLRRANNLRKQS
ncbi:MAG: D-glycero-beta-D-manno-heptose-7-phosphate kinase [Candidatus Aminicenantes bacterium]|nr:D-glycero-beta-D-manno-heptose-7-phosphate kinase [Candidatus Aminicenantes bacterium]